MLQLDGFGRLLVGGFHQGCDLAVGAALLPLQGDRKGQLRIPLLGLSDGCKWQGSFGKNQDDLEAGRGLDNLADPVVEESTKSDST